MKASIKVALIGLTSLENIAFREIGSQHPNLELVAFSNFRQFSHIADHFNAFIVSSDIYLINSDYFLPRKSQCIVVYNVPNNEDNRLNHSVFTNTFQVDIEGMIAELANCNDDTSDISAELSSREKDVLRQIAKGFTNKEIADKLSISVNTVITHRKNLSAKLGIKSASGLSLYALMNGLI